MREWYHSTGPLRVALDMTFPNRAAVRGTGSGVYAHALVRALRTRDDVAVATIAGAPGGGPLDTIGWLARGARRTLIRSRPEVLHCPAFVTPWRSPAPFIITMHDAGAFRFPLDFNREWRAYNRFVLPALARRASAVIAGTEAARADLINYYGLAPERIVVTSYGVGERYRRPPRPDVMSRLRASLANDRPLLLFCGGPSPRKNLDVALQAMAAAASGSALAAARLAISGASAEGYPAAVELIRRLGLNERVTWLGRIPAEEMPELYAVAGALVYPSIYEGFGLPPLEAMSIGTPVVASSIPPLREILGTAALLVDPRDPDALASALDTVLDQPEVRDRLAGRGKRRSAAYTWERCAAQTAEVYRKVVGCA
ncbi:MAG TPA: glycosyltransferase family 1 protein [Chloroflexota bacterium]|nr:glycosyltransferase family 1 protein [Chloroflexota bacterium]